ncbi:right-handed parallel beta-helix repeat-containing protein [Myxococcota bacterium]|nr:right-handed parallel beta-helix repeat-containing protein [Myxococcota bacterium]MBU1432383.1 right-handed parallel beta-helix repeat-containing protein [Myxococcota bacterium]MBU1897831.1 right-handed parallel beta-helix repeat-containing protein [Myxococcota bacterium]
MRYAPPLRSLLILGALALAAPARAEVFFVEPQRGQPDGDGSAARPWRTLEEVIAAGLIETQAFATQPYAPGAARVTVNEGAPIGPGDTIHLGPGQHGEINLSGALNEAEIIVRADPEARVTGLTLAGAARWRFEGLTVRPAALEPGPQPALVRLLSHQWHGPSEEISLVGCDVRTVEDAAAWSAQDWDRLARDGIFSSAAFTTIEGCRLSQLNFAAQLLGRGAVVRHNIIEGFAGDALRGLGDDGLYEGNFISGCVDVNENHDDGFQSWSIGVDGVVGAGVVRGITLRGNFIINLDDPDAPLRCKLQGIGCFDGFFEGWRVENNVIITNHYHGITLTGARDSVIVNNTVLGLSEMISWIGVMPHKDGRPSERVVVRNNLASDFSVEGDGVEFDHNQRLDAPVDHFIDVFGLDLHLRSDAPSLDVGAQALAPLVDAEGHPRPQGLGIDLGAYERVVAVTDAAIDMFVPFIDASTGDEGLSPIDAAANPAPDAAPDAPRPLLDQAVVDDARPSMDTMGAWRDARQAVADSAAAWSDTAPAARASTGSAATGCHAYVSVSASPSAAGPRPLAGLLVLSFLGLLLALRGSDKEE